MDDKPLTLIVEDDYEIASIVSTTLERISCCTEVVHDGKKALETLNTLVPDLIVLDLGLPHTSGLEILRYIRATSRLASVAVIVITAYDDLALGAQADADVVLVKPFRCSELRDLATRLLEQRNTPGKSLEHG